MRGALLSLTTQKSRRACMGSQPEGGRPANEASLPSGTPLSYQFGSFPVVVEATLRRRPESFGCFVRHPWNHVARSADAGSRPRWRPGTMGPLAVVPWVLRAQALFVSGPLEVELPITPSSFPALELAEVLVSLRRVAGDIERLPTSSTGRVWTSASSRRHRLFALAIRQQEDDR